MAKETILELPNIPLKRMHVTIRGTGELILNKMNDYSRISLIKSKGGKALPLEKPDYWYNLITSIHWLNGKPDKYDEETFKKMLDPKYNMPCISTFGLAKSFKNTVIRSKQGKGTEFEENVQVFGKTNKDGESGLAPVKFSEHYIEEKLMPGARNSQILAELNHFVGWSSEFDVAFIDINYSAEKILNIINTAGYFAGIGSGRTSGYGRYEVVQSELF